MLSTTVSFWFNWTRHETAKTDIPAMSGLSLAISLRAVSFPPEDKGSGHHD